MSARKVKLAAMTGAGVALLSVFPAVALVGGAPEASHSIARHVVMVVGSDKTFCSGVVIAQDLILTAAQCIHPATKYSIIGFDAPKTLKNVASTIVHPDWDSSAYLKRRVSADVALLKLAARLPPAYMPLALADAKVVTDGFQVTVAGYGQAIAGALKTGGKLRAADLMVTGNPGSFQIRLVDPNTKGELAGLGSCWGDSGGPVLDAGDGRLAVLGIMSWATGPALSTGCGGLTGVTPIVRYRDWVIKTAAAMGSALSPMAPAKPSEDSPKPAQTVIRLPDWTGKRPPMPVNYAAQDLNAQEIFRTIAPSVYLIIAGSTRANANIGSAVAVAADTALTNCHVIENQPLIMVLDEATTQPLKASVSSADRSSDRCLLKVDGSLNPIAAIRRFKDLSIGERVYTIGNPSGLSKTLGEGLISGLREHDGIRYVQTTAQISRGSSGGALVDSKGALVGITTFLLKDAQNLNFAIAAEEYWR